MNPSRARISVALQCFPIVRHQVLHVGDHFDLDEIAAPGLAGDTGNAHRLLRVSRSRGVGQQGHLLGDEIKDVFRPGGGVDPSQGNGDHLRSAGRQHLRNLGIGRELAGAGEQAIGKAHASQIQDVVCHGSASADKTEQFEPVTRLELDERPLLLFDNLLVEFHHQRPRCQSFARHQFG
jgi:hypothetical protein